MGTDVNTFLLALLTNSVSSSLLQLSFLPKNNCLLGLFKSRGFMLTNLFFFTYKYSPKNREGGGGGGGVGMSGRLECPPPESTQRQMNLPHPAVYQMW